MSDLVAFLTARYDEDEVAAQACKPGPWMEGSERPHLVNGVIYGQSTGWTSGGHLEQVCTVNIDYAGEAGPANLAHMVRHDPARVLADLTAKRRILKLHFPMILHGGGGAAWYDTTRVCGSCVPPRQFPETAWPCLTARALALPYAEHPDFDPTWSIT